jgi:hypothetical protein
VEQSCTITFSTNPVADSSSYNFTKGEFDATNAFDSVKLIPPASGSEQQFVIKKKGATEALDAGDYRLSLTFTDDPFKDTSAKTTIDFRISFKPPPTRAPTCTCCTGCIVGIVIAVIVVVAGIIVLIYCLCYRKGGCKC